MGIDGAEIKRFRKNKEMGIADSPVADNQVAVSPAESQQNMAQKKSTIDSLRPFVFAFVVPLLLVAIIIEYVDDRRTPYSPPRFSSNSNTYSPPPTSSSGYAEAAAAIMNIQLGNVCHAEISGIFSKTLKIDWTSKTTKLHAIMVLGEVGKMKEKLYDDGVRYFQFPNDAGTYNVIDWKTGEKESISDRSPYSFNR